MDWTQAFAIIGSLGAFTFWLFNKLDSDIKILDSKVERQSERTDKLYTMFIDLLKERK